MDEKTPEDRANKEVDKLLAKAIAKRKLEVKRYEAKIKKLNKEIEQIKNGELVPDEGEESSSDSFPTKIIERHIIREKREVKGWDEYYKPFIKDWNRYYKPYTFKTTYKVRTDENRNRYFTQQ